MLRSQRSANPICIVEAWQVWGVSPPRPKATFALVESKRRFRWLQGKGSPASNRACAKLDHIATANVTMFDEASGCEWRVKQPLEDIRAQAFVRTRMAIRGISNDPYLQVRMYEGASQG